MTSGLTLTPEQEQALQESGVHVALRAGAGCGKTWVLTERFLRFLRSEPRNALARIVVLTFTEKAARELRGRVREACRRLSLTEPGAVDWQAILRGLDAASIGTFHSYCAQLIRRFAVEAGVDPGFRVLEESIAPTLLDEVLARLFRRWLAERNEDLVALAVEHGLSRVRDILSDLLEARTQIQLDDWAGRDPDAIVEHWRAIHEARVLPDLMGAVASVSETVARVLFENECRAPGMTKRRRFLLENLPLRLETGLTPDLLRSIREEAHMKGVRSNHWDREGVHELVRDSLGGLRDAIDSALDAFAFDQETTFNAAVQGLRLARLAAQAVEEFDASKRTAGTLDFDDLMLRSRDLLRSRPDVLARLRSSIRLVLVDEFQDTDPVQAEILRMISGELDHSSRLYLVGDTKQSIYRFRGAQPGIFDEFRSGFPSSGHRDLTANFRSVPALLDFVNALFADSFPDPPLRPGGETFGLNAEDDPPSVEFLWSHEDDPEAGKGSVSERRKVEARWIARHLASRLAEGWMIRDRKAKLLRRAGAGDVVILFRTLNDAGAYESALVAEGLDFHIVGGSAFFAQQEVLDVINLLSAIDDPLDQLALAACLRGPFGCVSDEGLYWLATSPFGDLTGGFAHFEKLDSLPVEDRARIARLKGLLERWRREKDASTIADLLGRAVEDSGYDAYLLGEHLGARKRANVRKLVRQAQAFDAQGGLTLSDFVARLRADIRKPPREEQASTTDEQGEAVRLMTIHQAKGLEFPIVVLADLDRRNDQSRSVALFHAELGPIARPSSEFESETGTGESLGYSIYKHIERKEDDAEALRLFYVAATRAEDAVILSACTRPEEPPVSPAMKLLDQRFDRATGALCCPLPEGWMSPRVRVITSQPRPAEFGRHIRTRRPDLTAVSKRLAAIEASTEPPAPNVSLFRPRYVDLNPALSLSPILSRLDPLIRSVLREDLPRHLEGLSRLVRDIAAAQAPMVTRRVQAEAVMRLTGLFDTALAEWLARAATVQRGLDWVESEPIGNGDIVAYRGFSDLLLQLPDGTWRLVAISLAEADQARERLRLRLGARHAMQGLRCPPTETVHVTLAPGGLIEVSRLEDSVSDLTQPG